MKTISHRDAEQHALERAEAALDLSLETELTRELPESLPASLRRLDHVFLSSELVDDMLRGRKIAAAIFPKTESRIVSEHTKTPTEKELVLEWQLRVALCFVPPDPADGARQPRLSGRRETPRERCERLARGYRAALLEVMLKQLQGGAGITTCALVSAHAVANTFDNLGLIGRAWADLRLRQIVTVPTPTYEVPCGE